MHIHSSKENFQPIKTHDIQSTLKNLSDLNVSGLTTGGDAYAAELSHLAPNHLEVIFHIAQLRYNQKKFKDGIAILSKGLLSHPNHTELRVLLLACYKDSNDIRNLLILAHQMADNPANDDEKLLAYTSFLHACDWKSANELEQAALQVIQKGNVSTSYMPGFLLASNGLPSFSTAASYQAHRKWAKVFEKGKKTSFSKRINGRIRIAYISADFYHHPVGFFMLEIIAKHHKDIFEIFCYAHVTRHDGVTDMFIENSDHFIDISNMDNNTLFARIHQDKIHIAVDLASHTDKSKTPIFANRIAPVQISYLGYPNTTGLKEMDFHITDHFAEDLKKGTRYTEKLLFMPKTFLCYGMEWDVPKKTTTPCQETGYITFASFNNRRKLNLDVIQTWASILSQVPNSRLLLKFDGSGESIIIDFIHQAFEQFGIDKLRIVILAVTATEAEHMLQYHKVDIALDTFPYTGTTTTCEVLSQGVPIITLVGPQHAHRVSYSILKNIGFEETIAYSKEEYIEKAVQFANNPQGLSSLRGCLPLLLKYSPLRDSEQFVTDLEDLYKTACKKKHIKLNLSDNRSTATLVDQARKLHIGGQEKHPDWEILDANQSDLTDHVGNANDLSRFEDNTFEAVYSSHVLEHFSYQGELPQVLAEWYRVLKPGGMIYASVPNMDVLCELFLNKKELPPQDRFMIMRMMFGGQIDPYDFHKVGYNLEILSSYLEQTGFKNIRNVIDFGLFKDTSNMEFHGKRISLNLIAEKM